MSSLNVSEYISYIFKNNENIISGKDPNPVKTPLD